MLVIHSIDQYELKVSVSLLQAYTQFSNLCRHKRMHSDCRRIHLQCPRCLQSFASGTLLAKHQENCDKNDNLTSDLSTSEWPLGPQEEVFHNYHHKVFRYIH